MSWYSEDLRDRWPHPDIQLREIVARSFPILDPTEFAKKEKQQKKEDLLVFDKITLSFSGFTTETNAADNIVQKINKDGSSIFVFPIRGVLISDQFMTTDRIEYPKMLLIKKG